MSCEPPCLFLGLLGLWVNGGGNWPFSPAIPSSCWCQSRRAGRSPITEAGRKCVCGRSFIIVLLLQYAEGALPRRRGGLGETDQEVHLRRRDGGQGITHSLTHSLTENRGRPLDWRHCCCCCCWQNPVRKQALVQPIVCVLAGAGGGGGECLIKLPSCLWTRRFHMRPQISCLILPGGYKLCIVCLWNSPYFKCVCNWF